MGKDQNGNAGPGLGPCRHSRDPKKRNQKGGHAVWQARNKSL